jgi:hypothetical protein
MASQMKRRRDWGFPRSPMGKMDSFGMLIGGVACARGNVGVVRDVQIMTFDISDGSK